MKQRRAFFYALSAPLAYILKGLALGLDLSFINSLSQHRLSHQNMLFMPIKAARDQPPL